MIVLKPYFTFTFCIDGREGEVRIDTKLVAEITKAQADEILENGIAKFRKNLSILPIEEAAKMEEELITTYSYVAINSSSILAWPEFQG